VIRVESQPKIVVIGSGAAGMVCVDTLREYGLNRSNELIKLFWEWRVWLDEFARSLSFGDLETA